MEKNIDHKKGNLISVLSIVFCLTHAGALEMLISKLGVTRFLDTLLEEASQGEIEGIMASRAICVAGAFLLFKVYTELWRLLIISHKLQNFSDLELFRKVICFMAFTDGIIIVISSRVEYASSSLQASQNGLGLLGYLEIGLWAVFNVCTILSSAYVIANRNVEEELSNSQSLLSKKLSKLEKINTTSKNEEDSEVQEKTPTKKLPVVISGVKSVIILLFFSFFTSTFSPPNVQASSMIRGKLTVILVDTSIAKGNLRNEKTYTQALRDVIEIPLNTAFNVRFDRVSFFLFNDDVLVLPMMSLSQLNDQKHNVIQRFVESYNKKQLTRNGLTAVTKRAVDIMCGGNKSSTFKYQHLIYISDMIEKSTIHRGKLNVFDFSPLLNAGILINILFIDRQLRSEYDKQGKNIQTLLPSFVSSNMPTVREIKRHRKSIRIQECQRFLEKPLFFWLIIPNLNLLPKKSLLP